MRLGARRVTDVAALTQAGLMEAALTQIVVRNLPVMADIGIEPHEIGQRQRLLVTVTLSVDAVVEDAIDATVDYRLVSRAAQALGEQRIALIETFGRRLASQCLGYPGVRQATVTIDKPDALPAGIASISIMLRDSDPA